MGKKQYKKPAAAACVAGGPSWRVGVFVLIQIVVVVLVLAGYDLPTALACATGGGLVSARVAQELLAPQRPVRGA
ncbi:hypothetical protein [Streptomyces rhizosphaerihabitans]|uniref:hypothetical protein n=1 Tax=Streptomyces rhizosphaerihabitans TaxID=1266770 RepID=UPI0021C08014|nr:hypothetical protein [Streptomyces rhizosphaerihabitans]MCT9011303.1 hypothetical protein [Streptomyces rhizosphaerihabitans]